MTTAEDEVRALCARVTVLEEGARQAVERLVVLPLVVLLVVALGSTAYAGEDEDDRRVSLLQLVERARDTDNGAVRWLALLVVLTALAAVGAALVRRRRAGTVALVAAGALLVLWVALRISVAYAGGGGRFGELGFEATGGAWWPGVLALAVVSAVLARRAVEE